METINFGSGTNHLYYLQSTGVINTLKFKNNIFACKTSELTNSVTISKEIL